MGFQFKYVHNYNCGGHHECETSSSIQVNVSVFVSHVMCMILLTSTSRVCHK